IRYMLFHTPGFLLLFFPIVLIGFRLIGNNVGRQLCLLAISYIFYSGADPLFLLLLVATSLVDFWAGLKVANARSRMTRQAWLLVSLNANLLCLLFFKYSPLVLEFANAMGAQLGFGRCFPDVTVIPLPPGISFYSFQSMSYTIDVYRGF